MFKFFIFLIVIIISFLVISRYIKKRIRAMFMPFDHKDGQSASESSKVIFDKDGITVMKGEAKDKNY